MSMEPNFPFGGFVRSWAPTRALRQRVLPPEFWPENEDLRIPRQDPLTETAEEYLISRPWF